MNCTSTTACHTRGASSSACFGPCAGSYFNRGKILGMLGMEEEAQEAYREAVQQAAGVAPGSFAKALASLKTFDDEVISAMEEAVRFLHLSKGMSPWLILL